MRNWKDLVRIDRQTKVPLYHQIGRTLRQLIEDDQLHPGEGIPSEWELAGLCGVSRLTVRRALDELVRDGLLIRRHGVGTFVANLREAQIYPSELSFTKNMQQVGRTPSSQVLGLQVVTATPELAQCLDLEAGAPVFELVRVRLVDGEPLMLENTYLSQERFPDLAHADLSNGSLYSFLSEQYHVEIFALDQSLEPALLTDWEAGLLGVRSGSPAILSGIVGLTADGVPMEYTWSVTRGDRGRFYFHVRKGVPGMRRFTTGLVHPVNRK
jgi:GntR family transcriptional regulator, N-acetylglucosamine utilization regulator